MRARNVNPLPQTTAAFREGRLSYSKVRAITRVATTKNESVLLNIAFHGTTWHVEQAVSAWRREQRLAALKRDKDRHDLRELRCYFDTDGFLMLQGRFTRDQGAIVQQAISSVMEQLHGERKSVSAETSRRLCCDAGVVHWLEKKYGENGAIEPLSVGRKTQNRTALHSPWKFLHRRPNGECGARFSGNAFELMAANVESDIVIIPKTPVPNWGGEGMDVDIVVQGLLLRQE